MNRRARAAYGALLRLLPEEFVRKNGREMQAAFRDRLDVAPHHSLGLLRVWFSAGTDVVRGAPKVWMRTWRMRRRNEPKRPTEAIGMLEILFHDLRLALHSLARTPGPTAVVVITLILGIGANTAVFSVINGVVLRPFDYPEPERLFVVDAVWQARSDEPVPHAGGNFQFVERQASGFQSMVAMTDVRQNLLGVNGAEQITVGWVSRGLFDVTGVSPVLGRGFEESDTPSTVLLSYGLWQNYFGGDPEVLGETVDLDARPVTIIGVLPPAFRIHLPPSYSWPARIDLWKPPDPQWSNGDLWNMQQLQAAAFKVIGRAAPGVTREQLDTELATIARELRDTYQEHATADFQLRARPLHAATVGEVSAGLYTLFGAVLLVLLITCANVANVMLVRSESRKRQLAVRVALGASRGRITTMLLAESAVLSIIGTIGGVGLAFAGLDALIALSPSNLPRAELITIDGAVLAFAIAVSAVCTLGFGLLPAFQGSRTDPLHALQSTPRGATSHGWLANRLLVTLEVAISFALLTGAGLMLRTFAALEDIRPGFDHQQLLTFSASIPGTDYQAPAETHRFFDELIRRSETLPAVRAAAVVWPLPLEGQTWTGSYAVREDGRGVPPEANYRVISAGYFDAVNTRLLEGRAFRDQDHRNVAIVSRALAAQAWPDQPAVGKRVQASPWAQPVWYDVIGVADDIRYADVREEGKPTIYFATQGWSWADWEFGIVVRTSTEPMSVVPAIKAELAALDPAVPLARPRPMTGYVSDLLSPNTFALTLFALFAALAFVMATVGIYGTLSHAVGARTKEIGIRMALGSEQRGVARLVVGQGLRLTAIGVGVGMVASLWLSRFVASLLYGVTPTDPATFAVIAVSVVLVGAAASYVPARRAAAVDPAEALRGD